MRADIWIERASALEQFDGKGLSASQVASLANLDEVTVKRYANKFGFDFGGAATPFNGDEKYQRKISLIAKCASDGMTRQETADYMGISIASVTSISLLNSIEFIHAWAKKAASDPRIDAMIAMYRSGKTLAEVGSLYGVTRERVRQIISKHANMTAKDGGKSVRAQRNRVSRDARRDKKSFDKYGCSYEQYRGLVRMGFESQKDGSRTKNTTPTGAYKSQRKNAISRGIEWKITLWEWWGVWDDSGKWDQRGRGKKGYVMCRYGDDGAYEIGNVYIATAIHNSSFQPKNPYRKDHPEHQGVIAIRRRTLSANRKPRKRKHFDLPVGVTRSNAKFQAQISYDGRNRHIGIFSTVEEASAAYEAKRAEIDARYGVSA